MQLKSPALLLNLLQTGGITQAELAGRVTRPDGTPVSPATISHLVRGRRLSADKPVAQAIAAALGVELSVLFVEAPAERCSECGRQRPTSRPTPATRR